MTIPSESRAVRTRRDKNSGLPVGRPRKLTADAIIDGAFQIIDHRGADKLSMRSLASRLKVQATAIYTHFDNLDAIEEALVDRLLAAIPMPDAAKATPLREQLIEHFVALRAAHAMHPGVAAGRVGSAAWIRNVQHVDCVLAQLAARGVDMATAQVAYNTLSGVAVASALVAHTYREDNVASSQREALINIKALKAHHFLEVLNLPESRLPVEQRMRRLLGILIDRLLPVSVASGGAGH